MFKSGHPRVRTVLASSSSGAGWFGQKENLKNERFRSSPVQVFKGSTKLKVVLKLEQNEISRILVKKNFKEAKSREIP